MQTLVRVLDGELADDEIAALTAVLLARSAAVVAAAAEPEEIRVAREYASWRREERTRNYRSPISWR